MAQRQMGRYCKAYLLREFQVFPDFEPDRAQARPEEDGEVPRSLGEGSIVYLQEDLTVTDGVFREECVLFSETTPAWAEFCRGTLGFEVPADVLEASESQ